MERIHKLLCNAYVSTGLFFSNFLTILSFIFFDKEFNLSFYASIFFIIWFGLDTYKYWIEKSIDLYLEPIDRKS